MNRNIIRLASVLLVGFLIAAAFLFYYQFVAAHGLVNDQALNRTRLLERENRTQRGRILDQNGVVLAQSERTAEGWRRVYTKPSLVHVVGYHSARFGDSAVEDRLDEFLSGAKGGNPLRRLGNDLLHRQVDGSDVVLTIDTRLQAVADEALGTDKGAIVAIDPKTGAILAMASQPHFDPNSMERDWERLREHPDKPLLSRATQGLYAPGSTFKTVTLAAALEAGVTQPEETFSYEMRLNERGQYYHDQLVKGYRIYDANHGPTEGQRAVLDLAQAYAVSCNVAFADLGLRLGARRLSEGAERFGFGAQISTDVATEASRLGSGPGIAKGDPALAATAFGQGELQVTPLQMVLVAAAVANGGVVPKPYVAAEVRGADGRLWQAKPEQWRRAMGGQTATTVASMMVASAEEGWAKTGTIPGVKVAAKTGTAETAAGEESHAWFIAFAPVENPVVAVAVIKEHAGGGAAKAGPAAKQVMEAALRLSSQQ